MLIDEFFVNMLISCQLFPALNIIMGTIQFLLRDCPRDGGHASGRADTRIEKYIIYSRAGQAEALAEDYVD
jgi:hypothetical protein